MLKIGYGDKIMDEINETDKMIEINKPQKNSSYPQLSKKIALIGLAIFVLATAASILAYPNYAFYSQYLSELGIGGNAIIFNLGIILCGALLIPLFVFHFKAEEFFPQLISFLGIAATIFFIGIGIFPLTAAEAHEFCAALFFITITMTIIAATIEFIKNNFCQSEISKTAKFFFYFISVFEITVVISYLLIGNPAWQKLAVLGIGIWLLNWIIILYKKQQ